MAEGKTKSSVFVGGAEKARRMARKRMNEPRRTDNSCNKNKRWHNDTIITPYPKSMREYDRFFGSLLSSSPADLQKSETDGRSHQNVMQHACSLLNVPSLPSPCTARQNHLMQRSSSILSNASTTSSSSSSSTFDNARSYYMSKAPLVLEESRCIIAKSLAKISYNNGTNNYKKQRDGGNFTLKLVSIEEKYPKIANRQRKNAPLILNFQMIMNDKPTTSRKQKHQNSSEGDAKWTRPGSVLLLCQQQQQQVDNRKESKPSSPVLACIVPNGNHQSASTNNSLSLFIFRRDDINLCISNDDDGSPSSKMKEDNDGTMIFHATALTTLIGQFRQMEACLRMVKVSFMRKLLGQKNATHIRFDNSNSSDEEEVLENVDDDKTRSNRQEGFYVNETTSTEEDGLDEDDGKIQEDMSDLLTKIPTLNATQERAAKRFLDSPNESLVLVQGPPGTGKTTFLVNVICRRLASNPNTRMMVTAPTNKAVTVLAERFLKVVDSCGDDISSRCNAVLVGVEEKLIFSPSSEYISTEALQSSLRSIFIYTWLGNMKDECSSVLASIKELHTAMIQNDNCGYLGTTFDTLIANVEKIKMNACMRIPSKRNVCGYIKSLLQQLKFADAAEMWESSTQNYSLETSIISLLESAIELANNVIKGLNDMESPVPELLATARVIFCTLSTAGASIIKQTRRIDDLLVDEAACATEPEMCIPFHLRPKRMLAVGDPNQLPATIISRHAVDLGFGVSLHERLMNRCSEEYVMLDVQYRMNRHISQFPCYQFYNGKISDGENVTCKTYTSDVALPSMSPYSFINIRGQESQLQGSYSNQAECLTIVKLVGEIASRNVNNWYTSDKLRIITFYQGQVTLLRRLLGKKGFGEVLVATVDSSQGCEADIVIVSFVRSSHIGFLTCDRRLNVALTRARHQLICVGDANKTLSNGSKALENLVSDAKCRGSFI